MASSLPAASAAVAATTSATKTTSSSSSPTFGQRNCGPSKVSFPLLSKPKLPFFIKGLQSNWNHFTVVKAQSNESEAPASEEKNSKPANEPSAALASEASLSDFITQVASLVKLVDSRDIVELQLKQLDCEVIIRKREALPQPPSPAPVVMMHPSSPPTSMHSTFPPAPPMAAPTPTAPVPSSTPTPAPSPPAAKSAKSSLPPLKCPMAGTFYRCSGPGEPPFVKVGDKVQKGQVVCIIEAMKLMNEIEADQSGTIVEILAEDGKPVSVDTPLFVIQP